MGDFTQASDDDLYSVNDAGVSIGSSTMRVRATANNGYAAISVSVLPKTKYTVSFLNDPNDAASGSHSFKIGTSINGTDIVNDLIPVGDKNTTISHTFTTGNVRNLYLTWTVTANGRFCFIDNISFKQA